MNISKRLTVIANLITMGGIVIDVGCDHGLLCQYLLLNNLATSCIACDISNDCLDKVPNLYNIDKRLGDGLSVLDSVEKVHTIVVAGMGGITIDRILRNYFERLIENKVEVEQIEIVLSPQSRVDIVRKLLLEYSCSITHDFVLFDGKFYDIIRSIYSTVHSVSNKNLSNVQLQYGVYYKIPNQYLKQRLDILCNMYQKAISNSKNNCRLDFKIRQIQEVLRWQ
ncbi:MAG: class I SAM-dependent methyltransferase [Firmicutes bacterium]|nr:class I SAM-dependent methyltransferase [Bacillota bacterium]MCL1953282.1 class I SAM-dependent methyltransferase [Bacillota bacterium]